MSLKGAGCAAIVPAASAKASNKAADICFFMDASRFELCCGGEVDPSPPR